MRFALNTPAAFLRFWSERMNQLMLQSVPRNVCADAKIKQLRFFRPKLSGGGTVPSVSTSGCTWRKQRLRLRGHDAARPWASRGSSVRSMNLVESRSSLVLADSPSRPSIVRKARMIVTSNQESRVIHWNAPLHRALQNVRLSSFNLDTSWIGIRRFVVYAVALKWIYIKGTLYSRYRNLKWFVTRVVSLCLRRKKVPTTIVSNKYKREYKILKEFDRLSNLMLFNKLKTVNIFFKLYYYLTFKL